MTPDAAAGRRTRAAEDAASLHRISSCAYAWLMSGLVVALLFISAVALAIGAVTVPFDHVLGIVGHHVVGQPVDETWLPVEEQIVWQFRAPRALLAGAVGAGLALVGAVLQAVVRNPLADPYLLGVSSGASLGAVLVLVLGSAALGAHRCLWQPSLEAWRR